MSSSVLAAGLRHLRGKLAAQQRRDDSDEQLLHAFTARRDDNAFAVLVRRHGPMVLHVCRRVLGHDQDAEDAFQATFLVLAQSASSLRNKASLASFLYGTAYRTALKAKQSAACRRKYERQTPPRAASNPADELSWREATLLLDEEIARLPEIYRVVFVHFYLQDHSHAETARRLGLKEATVAKRLAAARKRLAQRLARRGVELSAVLAAMALATRTVSALPAELMASSVKAALTITMGKEMTAAVSPSIAALVEVSSQILTFGKAKLAMLFLTVTLLASGVALAPRETESPRGANATPLAKPAETPVAKSTTYAGCVVGPEGKPIAGAKLYLIYNTPKELPIPVRAVSDEEGRFRFTVAHNDFDLSDSPGPWEDAIVVAAAKGYGLGLPALLPWKNDRPHPLPKDNLLLRLTKDDVPITGRVIDLQGKPVAGVTVRVRGLYWPAKGDLTAWLSELKAEKEAAFALLYRHLIALTPWMGRDVGKIFPPTVTGADGRFHLPGVGRERVVSLILDGPTIATAELFAVTRPGSTIRPPESQRPKARVLVEEMTVYSSTFEHIAGPCQPIVGVVRDKDTSKPIPGAVVRSYGFARFARGGRIYTRPYIHAVADKEGRYRLTGIPQSEENHIRAEGPDGEPYLMSLARVPQGVALEPIPVDFQLKRGIWIQGTVTDKATGKPAPSFIRFHVLDDNPFRAEAPGFTFDDNMGTSAKDGSFRFAGLPGRSVVMARAWEARFLTGVGADQIKGLMDILGSRLPPLHLSFNTFVEINPAKDAKVVKCNIVLDPGRMLTGTVVDADGWPLAGAQVAGLSMPHGWGSLQAATFTVAALRPGETRLLQFAHAGKHLAGSLVVRSDTKGPLTVKLKPAGTLTGRFVRPDGKPFADVELYAATHEPVIVASPNAWVPPAPDPTAGTFPSGLRTDKDGKIRIENLTPGLKYRLALLYKQMYVLRPDDGPARTGATVEAGETKDLGDVTVKLIE